MTQTKDMNRPEIINELARHAHPTWYHSLLDWETHQLRELLAYYRGELKALPTGLGRIYRTKGLGDTPNPRKAQGKVFIGIDLAGGAQTTAYALHKGDGTIEILHVVHTRTLTVKHE